MSLPPVHGGPTQRVSGGDDKIVADGVNEGDGDDGGGVLGSEGLIVAVVTYVFFIIAEIFLIFINNIVTVPQLMLL